ncbi:type II toxin-antitoxin system RelE/ParE family toxin [Bradyrhizobium sp. 200]|uniref:type II toxin-antitoxin system RelE/ParE family toxin n=1 Tax=Bradyrhizobium sp. 200 TaxID=2782665 RepID=UPI001FFFCF04|nr:type II toxin-antitoxin system RelE/ParE family toxin [Bradyrhizobium sp. 200]
MRIRNVLHKGLRRFIEDDDKSGIQAAVAEKLRRMISFLQDMQKETELKAVPSWKAHWGPQGDLEPFRHQELAADVSDRPKRD